MVLGDSCSMVSKFSLSFFRRAPLIVFYRGWVSCSFFARPSPSPPLSPLSSPSSAVGRVAVKRPLGTHHQGAKPNVPAVR